MEPEGVSRAGYGVDQWQRGRLGPQKQEGSHHVQLSADSRRRQRSSLAPSKREFHLGDSGELAIDRV
jgi:hypothetical protein